VNAPARSALAPARAGRRTELRCSYIWRQEVMADHVAMPGEPISLGGGGHTTFVTPRLGLPEGFAILRPGTRGWVLTLGTTMHGRLCVGGKEREVADFVARGGGGAEAEGSFRATPVGSGDWGVIELDPAGEHVFFFQFVDRDPPIPGPLLLLGPLMAPALAFSIILHGIFVTITYLQKGDDNAFVYPGDRDLLTAYLIKRPPEEAPPEEKKPEPKAAGTEEAKTEEKKPAATEGKEGRSGGRGERRSTAPDPKKGRPDKPVPKVAFLDEQNTKTIDEIAAMGGFDEDFGKTLARLKRNQYTAGDSGKGHGSGTGVGDEQGGTGTTRGSKGDGSGGGGKAHEDVVNQKGVEAGGERAGHGNGGAKPREVKLDLKGSSGDFTGLSKDEVDRVIKQNAGKFRACYQAALNRDPTLSGKVTVRFVIKDEGGRGVVKRVSIDRGGTNIGSASVEDCVKGKVQGLTFPAKGGAIVNYPFIFSNG